MKNQTNQTTNPQSFYYPPGGILLWIIIFLELLTFIIGIAVFLSRKANAPELFAQSQALLNRNLGTLNTLILITGGFMMATAVQQLRRGQHKQSLLWVRGAALMGLLFLGIKSYEYVEKINHGYSLEYNSFFTFYWMLTGFHFIHVMTGVVILLFMAKGIRKGSYHRSNYQDVESGAAFWHMCDLIWLLLFPVLYLMP